MSSPGIGVEDSEKLNLRLGRDGLSGYDAEAEFVRLTDALRLLQDRVAGARPSAEAATAAAIRLENVAAELARFAVDEDRQVSARVLSDPGRGQTLLPPFRVDSWGPTWIDGRVRFSRYHLGSNGATHGGAISQMFDDLLGQLANAPGSSRARTARIEIVYLKITPLDRELDVSVRVSSHEGRKIVITGELHDADGVLARAEGLFIELRPGQP